MSEAGMRRGVLVVCAFLAAVGGLPGCSSRYDSLEEAIAIIGERGGVEVPADATLLRQWHDDRVSEESSIWVFHCMSKVQLPKWLDGGREIPQNWPVSVGQGVIRAFLPLGRPLPEAVRAYASDWDTEYGQWRGTVLETTGGYYVKIEHFPRMPWHEAFP